MDVLETTERERRGLWLGLLGVVIFAMTLPMTRLAVGDIQDPQLPPFSMTAGRAAGAGVLSLVWLLFGFWLRALLGCGLVVAFALREGGGITVADLLLLGAVLSAAVGYVAGAHLTAQMGAERLICWVLVLSLPLTVPASLLSWPAQPARASAWLGFGYVTLFSMWLGFFAWYRGLTWGGGRAGEPSAAAAALPGAAVRRAGAGRATGGGSGGVLAGRDGDGAGRAAHAGCFGATGLKDIVDAEGIAQCFTARGLLGAVSEVSATAGC